MHVEDLNADPTPCKKVGRCLLKPTLNSNVILIPQRSTKTLQIIAHRENKKTQTRVNHKKNAKPSKPQVLQEKEQHPKSYHKNTKESQTFQINKRTNKKDKLLRAKLHREMGSHFLLIYVCYVLPSLFQQSQAKPTSNGSGTWVPPTKSGRETTPKRSGLHPCHWIIKTSGLRLQRPIEANKWGKKINKKLWTTILVEVGFQKKHDFILPAVEISTG